MIVSQSLAQRMFPSQDAVNRHLRWTDPVMAFIDVSTGPRRVVGVVPDIDDEHLVPGPVLTVYHPFEQQVIWGGRLFVHARQDPYALVPRSRGSSAACRWTSRSSARRHSRTSAPRCSPRIA